MSELRNGEEILLDIPGVLYTESTEDVVAFSRLTQFGQVITAHGKGDKVLLRADRVEEQEDGYTIISRNTEYDTREFVDEDGLWLSRYKMYLPEDALAGLTKQGNAENMDTPETLTAYIDGGFLVGIVYDNNDGTWMRDDEEWIPVESASDTLAGEETTTFEVDPEQAADFVELFDTQHVTEAEAQPFSIEGA